MNKGILKSKGVLIGLVTAIVGASGAWSAMLALDLIDSGDAVAMQEAMFQVVESVSVLALGVAKILERVFSKGKALQGFLGGKLLD